MNFSVVVLLALATLGYVNGCSKRTYQCFNCERKSVTAEEDISTDNCYYPSENDETPIGKKCDYCAKILINEKDELRRICVYTGVTENAPGYTTGCYQVTDNDKNTWTICTCKGRRCNSGTALRIGLLALLAPILAMVVRRL